MKRLNGTKDVFIKRMHNNERGNIPNRKKTPQRCVEKLFHDVQEKPAIHNNIDETEILIFEVRTELDKMKRNKAAELDKIVKEMLPALNDFGIDKIQK